MGTPQRKKRPAYKRGVSQQTQGSAFVGFTEDVFKGERASLFGKPWGAGVRWPRRKAIAFAIVVS